MRHTATVVDNRNTSIGTRSNLVNNAQPISITGAPGFDSNVWLRFNLSVKLKLFIIYLININENSLEKCHSQSFSKTKTKQNYKENIT